MLDRLLDNAAEIRKNAKDWRSLEILAQHVSPIISVNCRLAHEELDAAAGHVEAAVPYLRAIQDRVKKLHKEARDGKA